VRPGTGREAGLGHVRREASQDRTAFIPSGTRHKPLPGVSIANVVFATVPEGTTHIPAWAMWILLRKRAKRGAMPLSMTRLSNHRFINTTTIRPRRYGQFLLGHDMNPSLGSRPPTSCWRRSQKELPISPLGSCGFCFVTGHRAILPVRDGPQNSPGPSPKNTRLCIYCSQYPNNILESYLNILYVQLLMGARTNGAACKIRTKTEAS
jgi:hypothetical protein